MTASMSLSEAEIASVIAGHRFSEFAHALDSKDWQGYQSLYSADGQLRLPWGDPVPRDRLAAETEVNLGRFACTHHMITNVLAVQDGGRMTVTANLHAAHIYPEEAGKAAWIAVARYDAEIVRDGDTWLFRRVTLTPLWQQGDVPSH
ncbi:MULTISPECIES: nuclear transport factor 2 family protein [Microbacterium]|uniref:nuclear transport factor 2 family protein n=1 Tax=Microbacterium TaxID=33882 RepID=UPI0027864D92|nr:MULTISPECIES: nuclear transport factor 2 family protein [Microbacterium]MDQ1082613.1 3-phenylpropionate/cinnamic acid dioxygenase small subunit [Microbacterium sp. SORGH_AS_0344]MDQ1168615.1 3-phenylpropionate/cinnamic acid dioxygenase small subunit [Microbacterium proteolyticum]